MRAVSLVFLCLAVACSAAGAGLVKLAGPADWAQVAASSGPVWAVEFYSPRCGTCLEVAPLFEQMAEHFSGRLNFGVVDIDTDAGYALATEAGILGEGGDGVPQIRLYSSAAVPQGHVIFSGWEVPPVEKLESTLARLLSSADAAENGMHMKQ